MRSRSVVQVAVTAGTAALVELVELAVEPEQRAEDRRVEEADQRIQFVDAVFQRRAGEHPGVAAAQAFDGEGGLRVPVLDALRLVEDDDLGLQPFVDLQRVGQHRVVGDHREKRRGRPLVRRQTLGAAAFERLQGQAGETPDLFLPFALQRGRRDDQHALHPPEPPQQRAGGHRLDGLAEAHLVGQQRALGASEVQHPLALIRKQRQKRFLRGPRAGLDVVLVGAAQGERLGLAPAAFQPHADFLRDAQLGLRHAFPEFERHLRQVAGGEAAVAVEKAAQRARAAAPDRAPRAGSAPARSGTRSMRGEPSARAAA